MPAPRLFPSPRFLYLQTKTRLEQLGLYQFGNHVCPRAHVQLPEDPPQVRGHRPRADAQHVSDLDVGITLRNQPHDLSFAWAEIEPLPIPSRPTTSINGKIRGIRHAPSLVTHKTPFAGPLRSLWAASETSERVPVVFNILNSDVIAHLHSSRLIIVGLSLIVNTQNRRPPSGYP